MAWSSDDKALAWGAGNDLLREDAVLRPNGEERPARSSDGRAHDPCSTCGKHAIMSGCSVMPLSMALLMGGMQQGAHLACPLQLCVTGSWHRWSPAVQDPRESATVPQAQGSRLQIPEGVTPQAWSVLQLGCRLHHDSGLPAMLQPLSSECQAHMIHSLSAGARQPYLQETAARHELAQSCCQQAWIRPAVAGLLMQALCWLQTCQPAQNRPVPVTAGLSAAGQTAGTHEKPCSWSEDWPGMRAISDILAGRRLPLTVLPPGLWQRQPAQPKCRLHHTTSCQADTRAAVV